MYFAYISFSTTDYNDFKIIHHIEIPKFQVFLTKMYSHDSLHYSSMYNVTLFFYIFFTAIPNSFYFKPSGKKSQLSTVKHKSNFFVTLFLPKGILFHSINIFQRKLHMLWLMLNFFFVEGYVQTNERSYIRKK